MKKVCSIIVSLLVIMTTGSLTVFAGEWVKDLNNWKYVDDQGNFVTSSWKFISSESGYATYYFDELGNMATGLKRIDGDVYAFNDDGSTITNSTVVVDGETYKTRNKGLIEDIPADFDVEAYNASVLAEKQRIAESIAAKEAEEKRIAESIANRSPEELAAIAASEAAVEAEKKAKEESMEAERIDRLNKTIMISKTTPEIVNIKGEEKGKITVTLLIPTLVGGNAEQINAVLGEKMKNAVYLMYEEKYGHTTEKLSFKTKKVDLNHSLESNSLTFRFFDEDGYRMFTLHMNTNTLEMWGD